MRVRSRPACASSPPDIGGAYPERVIRRRRFAVDADLRAGPLRGPRVDLALGAVGPLDADRDWDGLAVVADMVTVESPPLVGRVLDRLPVHSSSVEHTFGLDETVSTKCVPLE